MASVGVEPLLHGTTGARSRDVNRGLTRLLLASAVIHASAVGVVWALGLSSTPRVDFESIPVELVALGKERDPSLLPRKNRRPPPPKAQPSKNAVPLETKKSSERSRPSARAEKILQGDDPLDRAFSKLEAEGRPDGSPRGTVTDADVARTYEAQVQAALVERYELPSTLEPQRRFLSAEVELFIAADGRIVRHRFTKPPKNAQFRSSLERILQTTRLPNPPRALASRYLREGVLILFKPD